MNKNYSLGLYEKATPAQLPLEEKLETAAASGFDWLEMSIDESDRKLSRLDWGREQILSLRRSIESSGVPIRTMCLSAHRKYPMGSHDYNIRKKSMKITEKALALAGELGINLIQLAGYDVFYEQSDDASQCYFRENLQEASLMAAHCGVCMGLETMETPFLDTVSKGMGLIGQINSPFLGMYPDIGNLKNASLIYKNNLIEDLHCGSGKIYAVHLKETSPGVYRNMSFGSGHTEYVSCIKELIDQGVRMFTAEFWHLGQSDWKEDINKSAVFLREKIAQAELLGDKHVRRT